MTASTDPLRIPESSIDALLAIESDWEDDDELHAEIQRIAFPVVAAELRRLTTLRVFRSVQAELFARADELNAPV